MTTNFDGTATDDILFRDATTGDTGFYRISNGTSLGWVDISDTETTYSIVATGDLLGDGTADVLFRNDTTGDTGLYAMSHGNNLGWTDVGGAAAAYSGGGGGGFYGTGH